LLDLVFFLWLICNIDETRYSNLISYIDDVIDREFSAYDSVKDQSPKYVMSLDDYDMSRNGITHINIEEWLIENVDLNFS